MCMWLHGEQQQMQPRRDQLVICLLLALGSVPVQMTEGSNGTNDWGSMLLTPVTAGGDRPCAPGSNNSKLPFCDDTKSLAERVADLIGRLTLEEKIGELTTGNGVNGGTTNNAIPRLSIPPAPFYLHHRWVAQAGQAT